MIRSNALDAARRAIGGAVRGVFNKADDSQLMQTVDARHLHNEQNPATERFQNYGHTSVPLPPDQSGGKAAETLALFLHGNRAHPIIIAVDDRRHRPKNLKAGESALYDDQGQQVYVSRTGIQVVGGASKLPFTVTIGTTILTVAKDKITAQVGGSSGPAFVLKGGIAYAGGDPDQGGTFDLRDDRVRSLDDHQGQALMPMPTEAWRSRMMPASFRGVGFKVDMTGYVGGRRTVVHEFPKRDDPSTEDMGRRARRFPITGYIVGADFDLQMAALIAALETNGPGTLVHPFHGQFQVMVEPPFVVNERRDRGRMATIEVTFVEAGVSATTTPSTNTQAQASSAADTSEAATSTSVDQQLQQQATGTTTV